MVSYSTRALAWRMRHKYSPGHYASDRWGQITLHPALQHLPDYSYEVRDVPRVLVGCC